MARVVVTGGSGSAGRVVVRDLLEHGDEVVSVDLVGSPEPGCEQIQADLTGYDEAVKALDGADAAVHLAAIPAPGLYPDDVTFRVNTASTYNVFSAAAALGLRRVVWASTAMVMGLPYERGSPAYAPIDEEHPLQPEDSYALSKLVGEELARQLSRSAGIPYVGLRFVNIMQPEHYELFPGWWEDPRERRWTLWGYVDARDAALACRLALAADLSGAEVFVVSAADTVMNRSSRGLMDDLYPGVPLREGHGEFETLLSIGKARQLLGYEPRHSWRDHLGSA